MPIDKAEILARICEHLKDNDVATAGETARSELPFEPVQRQTRRPTPYKLTRIFVRDGFVDRYTGQRLVFPGVFRIISAVLPNEFPAHASWRMTGLTNQIASPRSSADTFVFDSREKR